MQTTAQRAALRAYRNTGAAFSRAWDRDHAAIVAQLNGSHSAHVRAYLAPALGAAMLRYDAARGQLARANLAAGQGA